MAKKKNLSNPFSTGAGGPHFEAHVQASFVALMLTGGYAPCLPCWPIAEIKLQGKIDGYDTDDLIVFVENGDNKERRRLLGQVKHSIAITQGSALFGEVMQAAWNDFNNPRVFAKGKDIIALITGLLRATDEHNVQWLLNQARHTKNADEFFRNENQVGGRVLQSNISRRGARLPAGSSFGSCPKKRAYGVWLMADSMCGENRTFFVCAIRHWLLAPLFHEIRFTLHRRRSFGKQRKTTSTFHWQVVGVTV